MVARRKNNPPIKREGSVYLDENENKKKTQRRTDLSRIDDGINRMRKFIPGFRPKNDRKLAIMRSGRVHDYYVRLNSLKRKIPRVLLDLKSQKICNEKLRRLFSPKKRVFQDMQLAGIPVRYERLSRVLSQLSRADFLNGEEAGVLKNETIKEDLSSNILKKITPNLSPVEEFQRLRRDGRDLAEFSREYDCRVFFDPQGFEEAHSDGKSLENMSNHKNESFFGYLLWGRIPKKANVLGIQVFDPRPESLLNLTKAMSKRRADDPIVIFDVYGNIFYPNHIKK